MKASSHAKNAIKYSCTVLHGIDTNEDVKVLRSILSVYNNIFTKREELFLLALSDARSGNVTIFDDAAGVR